MKTKTILVAVMALFMSAITSSEVLASEIIMINDTTALITFDIRFSATVDDHQLPIMASDSVRYNDRVDIIGYEITGAKINTANALLLSKQPISGTRYDLPVNSSASFLLMAIVTLDEPATEDLSAVITKIPYWMDGKRTTVHQNQLDELDVATIAAE